MAPLLTSVLPSVEACKLSTLGFYQASLFLMLISNRDMMKNLKWEDMYEGVKRIAVWVKWFGDTILKPDTEHVLMVAPIENLAPRYRDEQPK